MIKNTLNLFKENIFILNIFLILIAIFFFLINKDKFDTYKNYLDYSFEERRLLFNSSVGGMNNYNFINHYLSDLQFNKEVYNIDNYQIKNFENNLNLLISLNEEKIQFTFDTKDKGFLNFGINSKNLSIDDINTYVESTLDLYHEKLYQLMLEKKSSIDADINRMIENSSTDIVAANKNLDMNKNIEQYLFLINEGKRIIMIKGFNSKYRRLFLNSDEYLISCLILLVLFNFLLKNYEKILK